MVKSLPNYKILDRSKLKALADDIINVTERLHLVSRRVENIVGKGENAGSHEFIQYFLLFSHSFLLFYEQISFLKAQ